MAQTEIKTDPTLQTAYDLLKKKQAQSFEIYLERSREVSIDARDAKVETMTSAEDAGLSIRILDERRPGFSFTTSLSPSDIEKTVQRAFDIAKAMPRDEFENFASFSDHKYPEMNLTDQRGLKVPIQNKVKMALELEEHCSGLDSRIKGVRNAVIREQLYEIQMMDSNGEVIQNGKTVYSSHVLCKGEENGESQMGSDYEFAYFLPELNWKRCAERAGKNALELLGAKAPKTQKCPAIFRNDTVVELLGFLSSSFSIENIEKGRSLLAGQEGNEIFSPKVQVTSDNTRTDGMKSKAFDAEGLPSQRSSIVQNGRFEKPLSNLYYAKKKDRPSTATSSRGIKSPPGIGAGNLFLEPGKSDLDQLVSDVGNGIMITDLMGVHTANPVTGNFSFGASGILIEGGKLASPVCGFAIAGNLLELFRQMTDIGSDLRFIGSVGAPSVLVEALSIGGS